MRAQIGWGTLSVRALFCAVAWQGAGNRLSDLTAFRPPWVYPRVGAAFYGVLGLIVQAFASRARAGAGAEDAGMQA
jgi:hypothetical protein